MSLPELAMRIARLASRHDASRLPARVHRDDFDAIQIVGGETKLTAQESECAAGHMSTHADPGIFAERDHRSPPFEQRPERSPTVAPASTAIAPFSAS